jgi:hypothetical protein
MYPLPLSSIELGRNRRAALLLGRGQRRHVIFRVFSGDAARTLDLRMVFPVSVSARALQNRRLDSGREIGATDL